MRSRSFSATVRAVRAFQIATLGVAVLVAVVVGGGLVIGSDWSVEKTVVLPAPVEVVHGQIVDVMGWQRWALDDPSAIASCPWRALDDNAVEWSGPACGTARLVLVDHDVSKGAWLEVREQDRVLSRDRFTWTSRGAGTEVTWRREGTSSAIAGAWLKRGYEDELGRQMTRAFERLAARVREEPKT